MFTGQVIGYLGADAKVIQGDGKEFIRFSVSSNYDGKVTWISCFYRHVNKVADVLKKGTMVYVSGDISVDVFRKDDDTYVPNISMNVSKLELCGNKKE
ncbi:MAG: single-stranded DNA-binding protein [Dysgonamonadaceae bacterium]|jgi:single-stranded DNA-binding protein|nr:single-stranded DNA-binding protein [Dysgonamonadaceae bacterium]